MTSLADRYRATGSAARGGTLVIGPLAGALIVCTMAAIIGVVAADQGIVIIAGLLAGIAAIAIALRPERATLVVVAILYSNAAAIAVQRYDVPYFAGAALCFPALMAHR